MKIYLDSIPPLLLTIIVVALSFIPDSIGGKVIMAIALVFVTGLLVFIYLRISRNSEQLLESSLELTEKHFDAKEVQLPKKMSLFVLIFLSLWFVAFYVFIYQLFIVYLSFRDSISTISGANPQLQIEIPIGTMLTGIPDAVTISLLTLIILTVSTISAIILGWRNENRNKIETQLRIEKLELEIAELKDKQEETAELIIKELYPIPRNRQIG